jgi:hypothetical protein
MLEDCHILGSVIYYPASLSSTLGSYPNRRDYQFPPKLPFDEDEKWLYCHLPTLLLTKRRSGKYLPSLYSIFLTLENLRFNPDGTVSYFHPSFVYYLCKCFLATKNNVLVRVTSRNLHMSSFYSGPTTIFRTPIITQPYADRVKTACTYAIGRDCMAKGCHDTKSQIHPASLYILGDRVCRACMSRIFFNNEEWLSVSNMNTWFADGFNNVTINRWATKPLRYTLIGMFYGILTSKELSLDQYTQLGRTICEWPSDHVIDILTQLGSVDLLYMSHMFGPLAWKQITSLETKTLSHYSKIFESPNFLFFGWSPLPTGTRLPPASVFGTPLYSIDDPYNDPSEFPMRVFMVDKDRLKRYVIMRGSTYSVWRHLLRGSKLELRTCIVGYIPPVECLDGSLPLLRVNTSPVVIVSNSECLTWGRLSRLLQSCERLILYGSLRASIEGQHVPSGCFADILLTFRFLKSIQTTHIRYNVIIHDPGFELEALDFLDDPSADEEKALLTGEPSPCLSTSLKKHPGWINHPQIPALMKALGMNPLKNITAIPTRILLLLMPPQKRKRLTKATTSI